MKSNKKPPIKAPPLRHPGKSLEREIENVVWEKGFFWFFLPFLILAFALVEWMEWYWQTPRSPWLWTGFFLLSIPLCLWRALAIRRQVRNLQLGLQGEQAVGQYLDEHRPAGYRILHDILERDGDGQSFNIDHVLVGPGGIFVLETKTRSKPLVGDAVVTYTGQAVSVDGQEADERPLKQVRAAAGRIRDLLQESTSRRDLPIRPVVLYPGWWVEGSSSGREVWVLNPRALPKWLANEPVKLSDDDVALFASRLKLHVRDGERRTRSS